MEEDCQVLPEKEVKQGNREKLENEDLQDPLGLKDHPVVPVKRDLREREELVEHKAPLVLQVQLVQRVPQEMLEKKDPMVSLERKELLDFLVQVDSQDCLEMMEVKESLVYRVNQVMTVWQENQVHRVQEVRLVKLV